VVPEVLQLLVLEMKVVMELTLKYLEAGLPPRLQSEEVAVRTTSPLGRVAHLVELPVVDKG
jgi:hypothetical protein